MGTPALTVFLDSSLSHFYNGLNDGFSKEFTFSIYSYAKSLSLPIY